VLACGRRNGTQHAGNVWALCGCAQLQETQSCTGSLVPACLQVIVHCAKSQQRGPASAALLKVRRLSARPGRHSFH
jgi:hypothetical protein